MTTRKVIKQNQKCPWIVGILMWTLIRHHMSVPVSAANPHGQAWTEMYIICTMYTIIIVICQPAFENLRSL